MKHISILILFFVPLFVTGQSITKDVSDNSFLLNTKSSKYKVKVSDNGDVNMLYFGSRSQDSNKPLHPLGKEVTVRGGFIHGTPVLEAVFADNVREIELTFVKDEIKEIDGYNTLVIEQKDNYYPLTVTEYIRVLPEYDLFEKWIEVKNTSKKEKITMDNIQSGTFFLPKNIYDLTHLSGQWGSEFREQTTRLTQGHKTMEAVSFTPFSSSFFALRPNGETSETEGEVWFGSLAYSGNWKMDFNKFATGEVQVTGGINFWDQTLVLKPGESFTSPKMIIGYTRQGMEGVSQKLTSYTREKVLPASHRDEIRPVLYNSWYSTTFDVNEEQQLALAKVAKEIGVEYFVIDDGWFSGRVNDTAGLGDWTVDKNKFPNGLNPMIEKINAMGLEFGIWIEPEMVNPQSELYKKHPDWVFHYPNRKRVEQRNQLMLNLAREDVYQYLLNSFSDLLSENNIKFVKWDMNRVLANPGFPSEKVEDQRAVRIKYVNNLYRLYTELRTKFPEVWFENCAGGGGRLDLGMLSHADFCWVSDNTDPVERIFIQHSYLNAFPANTMISWITHEDWHGQKHPLAYKFDVAMAGVLGIGYDITQWTEEELNIAKEKIAEYKDIRESVQFGDHYRLVSPYDEDRSILQYVNKDQSESVIFVYKLAEYPNNALDRTNRSYKVKLRGLQPEDSYKFEGIDEIYSGEQLMDIGFDFPVWGAFKSKIFKLKKQ